MLDDSAVLDELAKLRDSGLKIGLSVSGPLQAEVIRQAIKIKRGGRGLFSSVQATWNLLERSSEEALREAHARGISVIVKEALANRRLTARGDVLAPLQAAATYLQVSPDAVALAAVLAQPWINLVLLGAVNTKQLEENLASASLFLSESLQQELVSMKEPPAEYWARRARLSWT